MDFGDVIKAMKKDSNAIYTREGWNGKGQYIQLQVPDEHSKMTLPYIFISTVNGDLVPWLASQTDMMAEDWRRTFRNMPVNKCPICGGRIKSTKHPSCYKFTITCENYCKNKEGNTYNLNLDGNSDIYWDSEEYVNMVDMMEKMFVELIEGDIKKENPQK